MPPARRLLNGTHLVLVQGVGVSARAEQQAHNLCVALCGSHHQRCLAVLALGVHVCFLLQERPHHRRVARESCQHDGLDALRVLVVHLGHPTTLAELVHESSMAAVRCEHQHRPMRAVVHLIVRVGPVRHHLIYLLCLPPVHGAAEGHCLPESLRLLLGFVSRGHARDLELRRSRATAIECQLDGRAGCRGLQGKPTCNIP
mmetsp:Transcript_17217/g.54338  ORF Transcript_17217/g.54338 Transcript_17217/m.54338 type:complete len:201 (-) Transcript_17217:22-624(-)